MADSEAQDAASKFSNDVEIERQRIQTRIRERRNGDSGRNDSASSIIPNEYADDRGKIQRPRGRPRKSSGTTANNAGERTGTGRAARGFHGATRQRNRNASSDDDITSGSPEQSSRNNVRARIARTSSVAPGELLSALDVSATSNRTRRSTGPVVGPSENLASEVQSDAVPTAPTRGRKKNDLPPPVTPLRGENLSEKFRAFFSASLGTPLSQSEVSRYRDSLVDSIQGFSIELDKIITNTNRERAPAEIWSTMDNADCRTLADAFLSIASRSGQVAYVVRGTVRAWILYRAGAITLPRAYATIAHYQTHGGFALWTPVVIQSSAS